jgi:hypothetical protein
MRARVRVCSAIVKKDFEDLRIRWHKFDHYSQENYLLLCAHDIIKLVTN